MLKGANFRCREDTFDDKIALFTEKIDLLFCELHDLLLSDDPLPLSIRFRHCVIVESRRLPLPLCNELALYDVLLFDRRAGSAMFIQYRNDQKKGRLSYRDTIPQLKAIIDALIVFVNQPSRQQLQIRESDRNGVDFETINHESEKEFPGIEKHVSS